MDPDETVEHIIVPAEEAAPTESVVEIIEAQTEHDVAVIEAEADGAATIIEASEPTREIHATIEGLRQWHEAAEPRLAAVEMELVAQTSLLSSIQASLSELTARLPAAPAMPEMLPSETPEAPPVVVVVEAEESGERAPAAPEAAPLAELQAPATPRRYVIR